MTLRGTKTTPPACQGVSCCPRENDGWNVGKYDSEERIRGGWNDMRGRGGRKTAAIYQGVYSASLWFTYSMISSIY